MPVPDIETLSIDTIRCLAMDAVQKANAGHPGTAMALAPVAYVLYRERMRHDPADPHVARSRPLRALGRARVHPPVRRAAPLGLRPHARRPEAVPAVGLAHARATPRSCAASSSRRASRSAPARSARASATPSAWRSPRRMLAERYNGDGEPLVDHRTYAICSDGDLMEGVSGEASSLAGLPRPRQALPDLRRQPHHDRGPTGLAFSEDVGLRYEAYGWHVQRFDDGWTTRRPARGARRRRRRPRGRADHRAHAHRDRRADAQDTPEAHGAPLGEEEIAAHQAAYGWDPRTSTSCVPDEVCEHFDQRERGAAEHAAWDALHAAYRDADPDRAAEFERVLAGALPDGLGGCAADFAGDGRHGDARAARAPASPRSRPRPRARRRLGRPRAVEQHARSRAARRSPAHRSPTRRTRSPTRAAGPHGRSHPALRHPRARHGRDPQRPHRARRVPRFGATFLIFSDYMRPAVRLACIMELPVIYVWTHDSVGLGEDGPTHQPIEHLTSLRAMPHMRVIRPADANETARGLAPRDRAHRRAGRPRALAPEAARARPLRALAPASGVRRGGYVLADTDGAPDAILIGSGAEVHDVLAARETLSAEGIGVARRLAARLEPLLASRRSYRDEVLPPDVRRRVSLEAGATFGWSALVGDRGTRSASTATAPRRRRRPWPASSESRPRPSSKRRAPCSGSSSGGPALPTGVFAGCFALRAAGIW